MPALRDEDSLNRRPDSSPMLRTVPRNSSPNPRAAVRPEKPTLPSSLSQSDDKVQAKLTAGARNDSRLKMFVLIFLVVQNSAASLLMRQSRIQQGDVMWNPQTGVIVQELIKAVSCVCLLIFDGELSLAFKDKKEALKTSIPAILYLIQNNMQYISVSYLDATTYAVLYQLKIISAATMSVMLLGKELNVMQWVSLVTLTVGVACVVVSQRRPSQDSGKAESSMAVGITAVLVACLLSGLAGVSFEKLLKGSTLPLWARNLQLALYSVVVGLFSLWSSDSGNVGFSNFFQGYNSYVWLSLMNNAFGGLLIAVVIKRADNILKNFSTSLSIILTAIVSVVMGDSSFNVLFVGGGVLVIYAVFLYGGIDPTSALRRLLQGSANAKLEKEDARRGETQMENVASNSRVSVPLKKAA
ncbi:unnamed protein product [Polarella glacialis]|uniref:Uncharacterized protein n=1 Tax=Polarella glacialis TaxID=89957 RepID=A0A813LFK5_POLGL|nr:unnamed protein product [Polarella glacialis]